MCGSFLPRTLIGWRLDPPYRETASNWSFKPGSAARGSGADLKLSPLSLAFAYWNSSGSKAGGEPAKRVASATPPNLRMAALPRQASPDREAALGTARHAGEGRPGRPR